MIRIALALVAASTLAACGEQQARPEAQIVKETVEVQVPCPIEAPVRPAPIGKLPSGSRQLNAALGAKLKEYAAPGGYADKADAAIRTCQRSGAD